MQSQKAPVSLVQYRKQPQVLEQSKERWGPGVRDINTTRMYLRLSDGDVEKEVTKVQF